VLTPDYNKYIELIQNFNNDKITVLVGIETDDGIYYLQIMEYGNLKNMCRFYNLQSVHDERYPEKFLMEQYTNKINLTRDEIKEIFNFSLTTCIENNIEFIWHRPPGWKRDDVTIPDMRVINEYCKSEFIWI